MIKIVEGGFFSAAHEIIKDEIRKLVEAEKKVYLIVPEQQTVIAEAEMTDALPKNAPLYFEATNFTRFANTVFRSLGGIGSEYCDKTHKALLMWRTLTELSTELTLTDGKREINAGTVEKALGAIKEIESLSISTEELTQAEKKIPATEGRLSKKLSDLTKIATYYKKLLGEKYTDAGEDAEAVIVKLRENPAFLSETFIFIEGFTSFTDPQTKLICEMARATDLTLHLTIPKASPEAFEYTELIAARDKLIRLADKNSVEKKLIRIGERGNFPEFIGECCDLLWRTRGKIDNVTEQNLEQVRIFEADTPYDECEFIAADIRRRVESGAKYKDFAIIARNAESYTGILDLALSDANVPHFTSKRREAASFEAIKLIYLALSTIATDFRREDVIAYSKCFPSGISRDACDEFELYTEKWQISGKRFTDGILWNMNPDGYTTKKRKSQGERLISLNKTREALITPILEFRDSLKAARTVEDYAVCLVNFLTRIGLEDAIYKRAEELSALGEYELCEENLALFRVISSSLDTLVSVLGKSETTLDGFTAQLKVVFSNADIGRIPSHHDAVTVGSADMLRLNGKKHIYLIGVNRGEFPGAVSDSSYFSDRDKRTLSTLGLKIEPDSDIRGARELYCFSRAFAYAKESVTLIYSNKNSALESIKRADPIDTLLRITDKKIKPQRIRDIDACNLVYSGTVALDSLGKFKNEELLGVKDALLRYGLSSEISVAEQRIENDRLTLSAESKNLLYKDELRLTQTSIDSYNKCPLEYFCKYNLSLKPEERAEFDARKIGSFIHAILEYFFGEIEKSKIQISDLTKENKEALIKEGASRYLSLIECDESSSKKRSIMISRLCRSAMPIIDGLCDEFKNSKFMPKYFELSLASDKKDLPEPVKFETEKGTTAYVYGTIDRVDTFSANGEVYVRVVDYKTGTKNFKPSDIDEGENLQMFLYLRAIVDTTNNKFLTNLGVGEGKSPIPAGVIYINTELGDAMVDRPSEEIAAEAIENMQGRNGMILNEPAVITATNSKYLPVKFKNSGDPYKASIPKLYSRDGWMDLCEKLNTVVGEIADTIKGGEIHAYSKIDPKKKSPCEYCKFKAFCRNVKI